MLHFTLAISYYVPPTRPECSKFFLVTFAQLKPAVQVHGGELRSCWHHTSFVPADNLRFLPHVGAERLALATVPFCNCIYTIVILYNGFICKYLKGGGDWKPDR